MAMSITELEKALKDLRLSGMCATLQARALQVSSHEMDFTEAFSWLVQDELDRRGSKLMERRFKLSGLAERKLLKDLDWSYNPKIPKRNVLELGTLKFIDAKENVLLIGSPGTGKSHVAKALALLAVDRGYKVMYREAHELVGEITEARALGEMKKHRAQMRLADLLVVDDLFLRRLGGGAGDELTEVLMSRYEKSATIITSNRTIDDWGKLLGDVVIATPLLDRIMHHGHLLNFEGKSWRLREAASRLAKRSQDA